MAHINRRYIDKHWTVSVVRGLLGVAFGFTALFGLMTDLEFVMSVIAIFLLFMGIIDSVSALYASTKKHGWFNSVVDALIDVGAAVALLFFAKNDLVMSLVVVACYTFVSGVVDILHGFLSTVDPTDRFMKLLVGALGCVMGLVILNAGEFEVMTFIRFFGAYMLVVGATSMIYGVHNRSQNVEDRVARSEAARVSAKAKTTAKKTTKKPAAKKTSAKTTKK